MAHVQTLGYITCQHDLDHVEADVGDGSVASESVWISCYSSEGHGVHGHLLIDRDDRDRLRYTPRGDIEVSDVSTTSMLVGCSKSEIPLTRVRRPKQTIRNLHKSGITAFDVAHAGSQVLATGGQDGSLSFSAWKDSGAAARIDAKGIIGEVTDIRYFPSGEVALVTSTDMRARVFGIQGSNPRTLEGHTRSVEACIALPPKGRIVLTASRDQSVKQWRVADASCLHSLSLGSGCNAIAIGKRPPGFEGGLRPPNGDEGETSDIGGDMATDLIALVALDSGEIAVVNTPIRTLLTTLSTATSSPALCVDYDSSTGLVASGHQDGTVILQRLGHPESLPLARFKRSTHAAVHSVLFSLPWQGSGWPTLLVAGEDGLPWRARISDEGNEGVKVAVVEEFMGIDTDSVSVLREVYDNVFAASKDGAVRRW